MIQRPPASKPSLSFAGLRLPEKVSCIYADTPGCDFKCWALGQANGVGYPATWEMLLQQYGLPQEEALQLDGNPIDVLEPIVKGKIPLIHIVSPNDEVVPPEETTSILVEVRERSSVDIRHTPMSLMTSPFRS